MMPLMPLMMQMMEMSSADHLGDLLPCGGCYVRGIAETKQQVVMESLVMPRPSNKLSRGAAEGNHGLMGGQAIVISYNDEYSCYIQPLFFNLSMLSILSKDWIMQLMQQGQSLSNWVNIGRNI